MRTVLISGVVVVATACGAPAGENGRALEVVVAFYPLAEAAERVGGDRVRVTNLTPAGVDPHDVELTPSDRALVEDADLVVLMGRGFQPALERAAAARDGAVIELLRVLPVPQEGEVADDDHDDDHGGTLDPHVWLDPRMMAQVVQAVADGLADADPDGGDGYRQRAAAYTAELDELDGRFEAGLARCQRRVIVTAHEAFGWLAVRYDLEQVAIAGISPEVEPRPARMAELLDLVRERGVTTVFHEVLVSPQVAEALAREAGVRTALLDPIEGLTRERLEAGETYVSAMDRNLVALREALGCE